MNQNKQITIQLNTLLTEYKSALIFAMIEGLKPGYSLKLIGNEALPELTQMLEEAQIQEIIWNVITNENSNWTLIIKKKPFHTINAYS